MTKEILETPKNMGNLQDLLSQVGNHVNIDDVRVALTDMAKNTVIYNHEKSNAIFQSNGVWFTHFRTPDGKRSTIRRKTREELEDALFIKLTTMQSKAYTFRNVYKEWIVFKQNETSLGNANKLAWAWTKYFENSKLADMSMKDITVSRLKQELIIICRNNQLTSSQAKEMKSMINMMYDYLIENDLMTYNPSRNIHRFASESKDYIQVSQGKPLNTEVFTEEEETAAINKCYEMFQQTNNTIYLGVILNFLLGLRVGELVALKFDDFQYSNYILHLCRSEIRGFSEDGVHKDGFQIKPYLKKHVPFRDIPIGSDVQKIVSMIKTANEENGFPESEWLFIDEEGNLRHSKAFHKALSRVNLKTGTVQKSNHKIRKTVISKLISSGKFSIVDVRDFAGHQDEHTTLKFYGRRTIGNEKTADIVNSILGVELSGNETT